MRSSGDAQSWNADWGMSVGSAKQSNETDVKPTLNSGHGCECGVQDQHAPGLELTPEQIHGTLSSQVQLTASTAASKLTLKLKLTTLPTASHVHGATGKPKPSLKLNPTTAQGECTGQKLLSLSPAMTTMKHVSNNQNIFGHDTTHAEALAKMGQCMLRSLADHIDFNVKKNRQASTSQIVIIRCTTYQQHRRHRCVHQHHIAHTV